MTPSTAWCVCRQEAEREALQCLKEKLQEEKVLAEKVWSYKPYEYSLSTLLISRRFISFILLITLHFV